MKETPILFSTAMVRAILEGRKTQTRRVIKPQPEMAIMGREAHKTMEMFNGEQDAIGWTYKGARLLPDFWNFMVNHNCPFGKVGDILWVRETWQHSINKGEFIYKSDTDNPLYTDGPWKPSIFMPKNACRIFLKIKAVRCERLQDISSDNSLAEGIEANPDGKMGEYMGYKNYFRYEEQKSIAGFCSPKKSFQSLWESINGRVSWLANPFVWVIEFEQTKHLF